MPIFEFACENCGLEFELLVRAPEVPRCRQCGATALTKAVSSFAVSSAGIREQTLQRAHRQGAPRRQEQLIAEREAMHHDNDH